MKKNNDIQGIEDIPVSKVSEDAPNDLIDWIGKKGLQDTKEILNELKVINLSKENAQLKERVKILEVALNEIINKIGTLPVRGHMGRTIIESICYSTAKEALNK